MQKRTTLSIFAILMTTLLLFSASALTVPTAIASAGLPDLTVTTPVTFDPAEAAHGDRISVDFTVKNRGAAASGSFHLRLSLSTRPWGTRHGLGNFPVDSLGPGASRTLTITTNPIPSAVPAPGDYYVTVFVDGFKQVTESNENNNIGSSAPSRLRLLAAPPPAPTITSAHPSPSTAAAGETITIAYNVANPGPTRTVLLGASIQLPGRSPLSDPANDRQVAIVSGSSTVQRSFVIPTDAPPGRYNLLVSLVEDVNNNGRIDAGDRHLASRTFTGALQVTPLAPPAAPTEPPVDPPALPHTIRVLMDDGSVVEMNLEEYLKGVVVKELGPEWVMGKGLNEDQALEALKAQAVAARTYAIARVLGTIWNPHAGAGADVCTTTCCQVWSDKSHWLSDKAVHQTRNVVMTYEGEIIQAFYFAHCDGKTRTPRTAHPNPWLEDLPYLLSVECICGQDSIHGHGVGMCQWGAVAMAKHGYTYEDILRHYYTGVEIVKLPVEPVPVDPPIDEPEPAPTVTEEILEIAQQVVEAVVEVVVDTIEHIIDWVLELFGEEPKEPVAPAPPTIPEERALTLAQKAANLAMEVANTPYLGDGKTWGGKGWNWNPETGSWRNGRFVDYSEIREGYYVLGPEGRVQKRKGLDCSGLVYWAYNRAWEMMTGRQLNFWPAYYPNRIDIAPHPVFFAGAAGQWGDTMRLKRFTSRADLREGDLVFFEGHVAMYVGDGDVIHAVVWKDLGIREILIEPLDYVLRRLQLLGYGRVMLSDYTADQLIARLG
ncbi:SpoIID/LytB domain-containing protein [Dehalococcoidia bacterium]|nr:SpoIID/LytB domain-containing protein [Dehalococcoidia bacterium]